MIRFQIFKIVDGRLLWHSLSFIHWLQSMITLTFSVIYPLTLIVNVVNDRRQPFSFVVVCQCRKCRQCYQWSSSIVNVANDRHWLSMSLMNVVVVLIVHSVSFVHWLWLSMSSIVNVDRYGSTMITVCVFRCRRWSIVSDRRRSSMSSMIILTFHSVVCSCTQQGQGDFLDVWIRKWCRTKLQIFSFMECYFSSYFATSKEYQQILLRTYFFLSKSCSGREKTCSGREKNDSGRN